MRIIEQKNKVKKRLSLKEREIKRNSSNIINNKEVKQMNQEYLNMCYARERLCAKVCERYEELQEYECKSDAYEKAHYEYAHAHFVITAHPEIVSDDDAYSFFCGTEEYEAYSKAVTARKAADNEVSDKLYKAINEECKELCKLYVASSEIYTEACRKECEADKSSETLKVEADEAYKEAYRACKACAERFKAKGVSYIWHEAALAYNACEESCWKLKALREECAKTT